MEGFPEIDHPRAGLQEETPGFSREALFALITDFERAINRELKARRPRLQYRGYRIDVDLEADGNWKATLTRDHEGGPPEFAVAKTRLDAIALAKAKIDSAEDSR